MLTAGPVNAHIDHLFANLYQGSRVKKTLYLLKTVKVLSYKNSVSKNQNRRLQLLPIDGDPLNQILYGKIGVSRVYIILLILL